MVSRNRRNASESPQDHDFGHSRRETTWEAPNPGSEPRATMSPRVLKYLGWAVWVAIAIFAYLNIAPYEKAIRMVFGSNQLSGLAAFVMGLPGIGVAINGALSLLSWLAGAVLWFILQTLELLPVLLFNNRNALKGVIRATTNTGTIAINPNDDPALASLKRAYNKLPYRIVRQFRNYALCAYVVDLCICLTVYPPVDGGLNQAMLIVTTGAFQLVNWGNVLMLVVTLFAVEILVSIAFMVNDLRITLGRGAAHD